MTLRGAGDTNWTWLNRNYPAYYPSSLNDSSRVSAVQKACANGYVYDTRGNRRKRCHTTTTTSLPRT
ncbi:hypothetical protein ACFQOZ_12570 [Comamonas endophytica]|uniref:hypothetical protein n=1 Tax=Comamonas endophytica TaxID=2949090 RepID=UPI00361A7D17